jgi:hypothetical protein
LWLFVKSVHGHACEVAKNVVKSGESATTKGSAGMGRQSVEKVKTLKALKGKSIHGRVDCAEQIFSNWKDVEG